MPETVDLLIHDAAQVVTCAGGPKRGAALADAGVIENGAVAVDGGLIVAAGPSAELQARYHTRRQIDATGKVVCPGFVDCHTHLVFGGERMAEFERKLAGVTYQELLAAGGGILSTMRATRAASLAASCTASPACSTCFAGVSTHILRASPAACRPATAPGRR